MLRGSENSCHHAAIVGLGGVGKTQIALEYAFRCKEQSPDCSVFWIPAYEPAAFDQTLKKIGKLFQLPGIDESNANVRALVKEYLDNQHRGPWLIIIDNADKDELSSSASTEMNIFKSLPSSSKGTIIITTRSLRLAAETVGNKIVSIGTMNQHDAQEVLRNHLLPQLTLDIPNVKRLVELLGFLPLAIVQAAAYMNKNDLAVHDYIDCFNGSENDVIEILSEEFQDQSRYTETKNAIATTWLISFNQIKMQEPLAIEYLSFMACLLHYSIPESILPPTKSKKQFFEALGTLTGYSFLSRKTEEGYKNFDMHRLVHLATRGWLRKEGRLEQSTMMAVLRLAAIIPPGGHKGREEWSAYLPHAVHLLQSETLPHNLDQVRVLFDNTAKCLYSNGQYAQAESVHRRSLQLRSQYLGPKHPDTLTTMACLAEALSHLGEFGEAEKLHSETLNARKEVLGEEHPDVMVSMQYLGQVHAGQGRFHDAEKLHRDAYNLRIKVLGPDNPRTLASKSYLAETLNEQGNYEEAESMHLEVLQKRVRLQGEENPATIASRSCLGVSQLNRGKYMDAEETHRLVLGLRAAVLGPKHPHTLITRRWIADSLNLQGRFEAAFPINKEVLSIQRQLLGSRHPDTLFTHSSHANSLAGLGQLDQAVAMHRDVVALRGGLLGDRHPHTLTSKSSLADVLHKNGSRQEAIRMLYDVMDSRLQILGGKHPDTISSIEKLEALIS